MGRVWEVLGRGRWEEGKSVGGAGEGERGRVWEVLGRGRWGEGKSVGGAGEGAVNMMIAANPSSLSSL
jgi:hypothetical protein